MKPTLPVDMGFSTELLWSDPFNNLDNWNQRDLVLSADHRTHSKNLDPITGEIDMDQPWNKVPMRHAALYTDEFRDKCQYIEGDNLIMKGYAIERPNPYRDNFTDDKGFVHRYGDVELHGGWLSSKERLEPGTVMEVLVDLSHQCMRAHRWSIWLVATNGKMYKYTVRFCEIDLLEAEMHSKDPDFFFNNHGLMKIVGGKAGDTPGGQVDFTPLGIDIHDGWHALTLVWHHNGRLEFYCDGVLCNTDDRTPDDGVLMEAQIIMSDEMTSGVKKAEDAEPWENASTGPHMPEDSGLTGTSIAEDLELMDDHYVVINHLTAWKIVEMDTKQVDPDVTPDELAAIVADFEGRLLEKDQTIATLTDKLDQARRAFKVFQEL